MFTRLAPRAVGQPGRGRGAGGAGRVPAAGDLAAGPRVRPAPGLDAGRPGRRDPGEPADPDRGDTTASPPRSRCPTGTWTPPGSGSSACWACTRAAPPTRYAAAALAGTSAGRGRRAAGRRCTAEGLLTETGHRRYGMHDLIRRYARDRAAADPRHRAPSRRWSGCWTTTSTPPPAPRPAWPARPGPALAARAPAGLPAAPDLADDAQALAWAAPSAPACSPASTTPPPPASTPGWSP